MFDHLKGQDDGVWYEIFEQNPYGVMADEIVGKIVIDIGGHFGFFSILANNMGAKMIIAAEANPINFVKYVQNTRDYYNIKAINAACTANTGDLITINNDGGHSAVGKGDTSVSTVAFTDVLSWIPPGDEAILKMDIEGAEYPIFEGTYPQVFRRFNHIYAELHGHQARNLADYIVNTCGFKITRVFTFYDHETGIPIDDAVFKFERVGAITSL